MSIFNAEHLEIDLHPADPLAYRSGPRQARQIAILLHGVGAGAPQLLSVAHALVSATRAIILLEGPEPFEKDGGGRQWYSLSRQACDEKGTHLAAATYLLLRRVTALAAYEGASASAVSIVGFSQGATMALALAAQGAAIGNCVALAGRCPKSVCPAGRNSPRILISYGQEDDVVPPLESENALKRFTEAGFDVDIAGFPGGHSIGAEQIQAVREFLNC
jgi:phospholipase/carboxylesterase